MASKLIIIVASLAMISGCGPVPEPDTSAVSKEIAATREQFWAAALAGDVDSMLSFHLDSSVYRLYENAQAFDYKMQADGHLGMKAQGITRIDFRVEVKDTLVFNSEYAMETWDGTTITWSGGGKIDTSGRFFVTLLYQHVGDRWKFRYVHASDKPK